MTEVLPTFESRAVIIGAGIAGPFAAAAIESHMAGGVIVLDSEPIGGSEVPRAHAHRRQMHNFLAAGQEAAEAILPGYVDELKAEGAGFAPVAQGVHVTAAGIEMSSDQDLGIEWGSARRTTYERAARNLLLGADVSWVDQASATGLVVEDNSVKGVRVHDHVTGRESIIEASIVVDASGFRTGGRIEAIDWLREHGLEAPEIDFVEEDMGQRFSSVIVDRPKGYADDEMAMILPGAGNQLRGTMVAPVETAGPGRTAKWHVSANRRSDGPMPRDIHEMQQWAIDLGGYGHRIARMLERVKYTEEPARFVIQSIWTARYDRLQRPLRGFLPIGDAVANRNALDGRGMTVAIQQAREMRDAVMAADGDIEALTSDCLRRVVETSDKARQGAGGITIFSEEDARTIVESVASDPAAVANTLRGVHMVS